MENGAVPAGWVSHGAVPPYHVQEVAGPPAASVDGRRHMAPRDEELPWRARDPDRHGFDLGAMWHPG